MEETLSSNNTASSVPTIDETAMFKFTSGLYVVSAKTPSDQGACIVNTGLQVTAFPIQVEVVVNKENYTSGVIAKAGHFCLAPLTQDVDMPYIGRFGFKTSADGDKFEGLNTHYTQLGDPYDPDHAACCVSVEVNKTIDLGTHLAFIGEVREAKHLSSAEPLTYGYYHSVLRGKTPEKASSYIKQQ